MRDWRGGDGRGDTDLLYVKFDGKKSEFIASREGWWVMLAVGITGRKCNGEMFAKPGKGGVGRGRGRGGRGGGKTMAQ